MQSKQRQILKSLCEVVYMYSKCGCLDDSKQAFLELEDSDNVLWSARICACGFHSRRWEAIKLFEQMESEGIEPKDVKFLGLLYACCHSGLKEQAEEYFKLMMEKYELQPRLEHYTCMVDLPGSSGCWDEAEALIRSMPVEPDAIVSKTLLSACKIHRNVRMAKKFAEEVLKLDSRDSAPYVLLPNIHLSEEKWGDVELREAIREESEERVWNQLGGGKGPSASFSMGSRSHLKWREIYEYLNELMTEIMCLTVLFWTIWRSKKSIAWPTTVKNLPLHLHS